jgi:ribosome-binding protein aMBF1 (putative translation factor)
MIKRVDEMDFYELLNLRAEASPRDIENAYLMAVATYHQESVASYGALGDADRGFILDKIEEAFGTLRDPEKKKAYNLLVLSGHPEFQQRAHFRRSTTRVEIEDASEEVKLWDKIKASAKRSRGRTNGPYGYEPEKLSEEFYYYGDYLKKVRERKGLSREDIAGRCGISADRIEWLEQESPPSIPHEEEMLEGLKLYAKCLGFGSEKEQASPFSDRLDE